MPLSTESLNTIPTTDRSAVSDGRSSEYAGTVTHSVREWIERFYDEDEYEDLPTENKMVHIFAGSVAGISEHCMMYPVDLVKTRMMALSPPVEAKYRGVMQSLRSIVATEGVARLWRGIPVVLVGAGPAHGMYFMAYEWAKVGTGKRLGRNNPFGHMLAGAGASLVHDAVMAPVDAVKQRMQQFKSRYSSSMQCAQSMLGKEGMGSFYRAYGTQICMNVPQQCIHFASYEYFKRKLNPTNEYRPLVHVASGALAGGIAAAVTTPLDVCKTLLNTQPPITGSAQPVTRGIMNGFGTIYRVAGFSGLWQGCRARVITTAPSTGICWCIYEAFKYGLSN